MSKTFTIDSNDLLTGDILVEGEVHISGELAIMNSSTEKYAKENVDGSVGILTVVGDLYIQSSEVLVKNAIPYYDMKLRRDETFDQKSTTNNSVVISTGKMIIYGKIKSVGDITYYSTKVHNKVKRSKIEKLIINIKNEKFT